MAVLLATKGPGEWRVLLKREQTCVRKQDGKYGLSDIGLERTSGVAALDEAWVLAQAGATWPFP